MYKFVVQNSVMQNPALEALNIDMKVVLAIMAVVLLQVVVMAVSMWKLFAKAGHPGWKALIPFYNIFILLKMVGKPWWWFFLMIIPIVNIVFAIWALNLLVRAFGRQDEYTVFTVFFGNVFLPALAFDKQAVYTPPQPKKAYKV